MAPEIVEEYSYQAINLEPNFEYRLEVIAEVRAKNKDVL